MAMKQLFKQKDRCPACGGSGLQYNTKTGFTEVCPVCRGTGRWKKPETEPWKMENYPKFWSGGHLGNVKWKG